MWQLVNDQPAHLLDPQFKTWDVQIGFAVDVAIGELVEAGPTPFLPGPTVSALTLTPR